LLDLFDFSSSRLVSLGLPFLAMTILYAALGLGLLALSKDATAAALAGHFSRRGRRKKT
jgi:hypothetical protein